MTNDKTGSAAPTESLVRISRVEAIGAGIVATGVMVWFVDSAKYDPVAVAMAVTMSASIWVAGYILSGGSWL